MIRPAALALMLSSAPAAAEPLRNIPNASLEAANIVLAASAEAARARKLNVCIVVLDEAARFVAGQCMDGTPNASFEVAMAKAKHSANFRRPSKLQEDLLMTKGALAILAIPGMMPLEGGLQLVAGDRTAGSVGVSGGPSDQDGEIAAAGVKAFQDLLAKDK